jgi:hypothetical protein
MSEVEIEVIYWSAESRNARSFNRASSFVYRAGEGIRTLDVNLGNVTSGS